MKNMRLTKAGIELLGSAHADGETRFWIGYYGLAYVADRETDTIKDAAQSGRLTKTGDYIFNIWQGDMLNGYAQDNPEDTAAASLFGLTLYDKSIRTNYRYVYDQATGRNRLVAWKSEATGNGENTLERKGVAIYMGTGRNIDGTSIQSEIPLPAPLYYGGEPNLNAIVTASDNAGMIPVSADYRYYVGTRNAGDFGWVDSGATQESETVGNDALLKSISNFNKFHGTVSSEGYGVSSVSSCHNMSKATKLFPISYYNVVNDNGKKLAETKYATNSPARKPLATAIKFSIDLSPITADSGYTALNYEDGGLTEDQSTGDREVYFSKYISFKFNRIGIYAVPMTIHRYSTDSSTDECNLQKVQFEIAGDEEPVLFAVADINDTIISDNPSSEEGGVAKFSLDFILNLGNGDEETAIEQRTAVYYNLYENDATTWYKNQLLASASLSEAVTDLSLEMNALKQNMGHAAQCCAQDLELPQYALKNHTHDYIKNLVDGMEGEGSVRGIFTCQEGDGTDIKSLFGLSDNAPDGTKKSCKLSAMGEMINGELIDIVESYLYCLGPIESANVPASNLLSYEQVQAIIQHTGSVQWMAANIVSDYGWYTPGSTTGNDTDNIYIWVSPTEYVKINRLTSEIIKQTVNAGDTSMYLAIVIKPATVEPMFTNGYSIGEYATVLGENTASSGDYSIVQGQDIYNAAFFSSVTGSRQVKIPNSQYLTISGAQALNIENSYNSLIFGNGTCSSYGNKSYTNLKNIHYSILGGELYDDGLGHYTNTMAYSMCIMQFQGPTPGHYGAGGLVSGSILTGAMYLDRGALNSVFLRTNEDPARSIYGQLHRSILLGEGYLTFRGSGDLTSTNMDKNISLTSSIGMETNFHAYYSNAENNYRIFKNLEYKAPKLEYSIGAGVNVCNALHASIALGTNLDVSRFSINSKLFGEGDEVTSRSIILCNRSDVGCHLVSTLALGGGQMIPSDTNNFVLIGDGIGTAQMLHDKSMSLSEFNASVTSGSLADGDYVILGGGDLLVWDSASSSYLTVLLSGLRNDMYAGVNVLNGHPSYMPTLYTSHTIYYENDSASSTSWTKTISLGSANQNRRNSSGYSCGIVVGAGHQIGCPGYSQSKLLVSGAGNDLTYAKVDCMTIVGAGNKLNASHRPWGSIDGTPQYPQLFNTHIFGNGLDLKLDSLDPFATHRLDEAFVFLNSAYDVSSVIGIYQHPVSYDSMPTDALPSQTWGVQCSNPGTSGAFVIDPNLFTNYKRAWMELDPVYGEAAWYSYRTEEGTVQPSLSQVTWAQVTPLAESLQSEDDEYVSRQSGSDPFHGHTRREIRGMVGKPNVPMMYTGGIALAGHPSGTDRNNTGLLKLGHVSKPVAYIQAYPTSGWFGNSDTIAPISITGTKTCPYAGMSLAIDDTQELDGTLHLVLQDVKTTLGINGGVGSPTTPVYVDSSGKFQACTSGDCVVYSFTGTDYPNADDVISNITSNVKFVVLYKIINGLQVTTYLFSGIVPVGGGQRVFKTLDGEHTLVINPDKTWSES